MKILYLKDVLIVLILVIGLSYLYNYISIDEFRHQQTEVGVNRINNNISVINQEIVLHRFGLKTNYNNLVNRIKDTEEVINQLTPKTEDIDYDEKIKIFNSLRRQFELMVDFVEEFRSFNSMYQNSLNYLPSAFSELLTLLRQRGAQDVEKNRQVIDELYQLHKGVLNYSRTGSSREKLNLLKDHKKIELWAGQYPRRTASLLKIVNRHVLIIIRYREKLDELIRNGTSIPFESIMERYEDQSFLTFQKQFSKSEQYKGLLFLIALTLLSYLIFTIIRLRLRTNALNGEHHKLLKETEEREEARQGRHILVQAVEHITEAIIITDLEGSIKYVNRAFTEITGWSEEESLGRNPRFLKGGTVSPEIYQNLWTDLLNGKIWQGRFLNKVKANEGESKSRTYWAQSTISPIKNIDDSITGYIGIQEDVTELVEEEMENAARTQAIEIKAKIARLLQPRGNLKERLGTVILELQSLDCIEKKHKSLFCLFITDKEFTDQLLPGQMANFQIITSKKRELKEFFENNKLSADIKVLNLKDIQSTLFDDADVKLANTAAIIPIIYAGELEGLFILPCLEEKVRSVYKELFSEVSEILGIAFVKEYTQFVMNKAIKNAEETSLAKSNFLSVMSHELRTPLNGILGVTQLLSLEDPTPETKEMLQIIADSGKGLLDVFNEILTFSRFENHQLKVSNRPFYLPDFIEELNNLFKAAIKAKNQVMRWELSSHIPEGLISDKTKLSEILSNLISNAIKFSDQGEIIIKISTIDLLEKSDKKVKLRFEVIDSGPGIAPADQMKIFSPFTQLDGSVTRAFEGVGLGLSIAKQMIDLLGGEIGVESEIGEGARFFIELEINLDSQQEASKFGREKSKILQFKKSNSKVLVVENDTGNQLIVTKMLQKLGCHVDVAMNGLEAVELFKKNGYDLIFMDIIMPVMDGYEATNRIREQELLSQNKIPIIAVTAKAMPGDEEECLSHGMDGYLSKPIKIENLEAILEEFS